MKFGLFGINMRPCITPEAIASVASAAEAAGYESVWGGEHILLPDPQTPSWPMPPLTDFIDLTVAIAFAAASTRTIHFGTGIVIVPLRNPVILAKQIASLEVMTNGRLIFGIGIGNIEPEFNAAGMPFDHKGRRAEESLALMKALWTTERPRFDGRFFNISGVRAEPRLRKPPQIIFGGKSTYAFSRTARLADGWFGYGLDLDASTKCIEGIRRACARHGRRFEEIEISITPKAALDLDLAHRYEDLGVQRLIVAPRARTADEMIRFAQETARNVIRAF
ncbi:MAG: TIGR03619 family F420-dependent LLM class oxidoreductase [Candidatus Binataceae bacterium]